HYVREPGSPDVERRTMRLTRPTDNLEDLRLDPDVVRANMKEGVENLRVLRCGNSTFEISTIGTGPVVAHKSTYNSAESSNKGNLREHANLAARFPGFTHLYMASFGNGGTSPLTEHEDEGKYVSRTGRFTRRRPDGTAEPIYSVRKEHEALADAGFDVSMIFGTDSAGGSYATALALAMEPGQLKKAFFSEHAGFVDLSRWAIAYGMLWRETRNGNENRELSPDPEAITGEKVAEATQLYDAYLSDKTRQLLDDSGMKVTEKATKLYVRGRNMYRVMNGLRRGPHDGIFPHLEDTNYMLEHQPDAKIVFGMAERDVLYKNPALCHQAARTFLQAVAVRNATVEAMILPEMSHAYHTHMPAMYHELMRRAILA
ncbi:MAG TPA: hypothetical protein VFL85_02190, partial [Candidatus Saccharimonadales bacterium]|nr:hypothetical protein [Candidatus Saccharimonadales bacterium]